MNVKSVSTIFDLEPLQWGLRGDPFLWEYLKEQFQDMLLPYSPQALREDILRTFSTLTGALPATEEDYFVEQFAPIHVGMSTGWLSGDFWLNTAIPLLMRRLEEANASV